MASVTNDIFVIPRTVTNKTIEDFIHNLTLTTLTVTGSISLPPTIQVDTINELTPGSDITIENTTGDIVIQSFDDLNITGGAGGPSISIDAGLQTMNIFSQNTLSLSSTQATTDIRADDSIILQTNGLVNPVGHTISLITTGDATDRITIGGPGRVRIGRLRNGGTAGNAQSLNAGQNAYANLFSSRIVTGCYFIGNVPATGNSQVAITFDSTAPFLSVPIVLATPAGNVPGTTQVYCSIFAPTVTGCTIYTYNDNPVVVTNVRVQWLAIGDSN